MKEVIYQGFLVNDQDIAPVKTKLKPIVEMPSPANVTELKSFLVMVNYYHYYLPQFAGRLEPLHSLLRKGIPWKWCKAQAESFNKVKAMLQSFNLLVHYDPQKPLLLSCDASPFGVGAVLSHHMPNG